MGTFWVVISGVFSDFLPKPKNQDHLIWARKSSTLLKKLAKPLNLALFLLVKVPHPSRKRELLELCILWIRQRAAHLPYGTRHPHQSMAPTSRCTYGLRCGWDGFSLKWKRQQQQQQRQQRWRFDIAGENPPVLGCRNHARSRWPLASLPFTQTRPTNNA